MKKIKKVSALLFTFIFLLTNLSNVFASNVTNSSDKLCKIYSLKIPNIVSEYAKKNFANSLEFIKKNSEGYGLDKAHLDYMYLGQGFNIFEMNTGNVSDKKIYYYPVMYKNKIEAIYTVGLNDTGSCYSNLGVSFAEKLQNTFQNYNDDSPFVLISSDENIYAQNKKGTYPIFIYNNTKTQNLVKSSFNENINLILKIFNDINTFNIIEKFDSVPLNKSFMTASSSKWLQVPIVNQRDSNGTQRGMCWAASAACVLNYKLGYNLNAMNICDLMRIGYDDGASVYTSKSAWEYYGVRTANVIESTISNQSVQNYINNNTPIYMSSRTKDDAYGHATVIRGYMGGSNGYMQLSIMNPATERYEAVDPGSGGYHFAMGNYVFYWKMTLTYN